MAHMVSSRVQGLWPLWILLLHHSSPAHAIVNGYEATFGENPWQALLLFDDPDPDQICGGSLIHPRYVLTAAHCLFDKERWIIIPKSEITVRMGEHDREDDAEPAPHHDFAIEEVIVHEGYQGSGRRHDIALLKLDEEVTPRGHIQVIPLAARTVGLEGTLAKVSGWGYETADSEETSRTLREVIVEVSEQEGCHDSWASDPDLPTRITNHHICAGSAPRGQDLCDGDSGGPLTVAQTRRDGSIKTVLIGVASASYCGLPHRPPGVYMRVATYIDWIDEIVSRRG